MKQLSAIILLAILVASPSCKYFGNKNKAMAALQAKQDSIRVADSIRTVQEKLMAIEKAKQDSIKSAEEALALKAKSKYNIIVGSFKTPAYAKGLADAYQKKGYSPTIIKMKGSTFELVSAESHETLKQAIARYKEFKESIETDAWIYINN